MPSVFSHAVAGAALGTLFRRWLGIPWGHVLGHRGITHSVAFAAALAAAVAWSGLAGPGRRGALWLVLFVATASHGALDAMTDGGSGVAFFAPFDATRYFLPWRPIPVSPMGLRFFSDYGLEVFERELWIVWLPSAILAVVAGWLRSRRERPA